MNIIETLKDLYATDKAACLNKLPELFRMYNEGLIKVLPCKVGDKVKVRADTWGYTGNFKTIEDGKFLVGEIIAKEIIIWDLNQYLKKRDNFLKRKLILNYLRIVGEMVVRFI